MYGTTSMASDLGTYLEREFRQRGWSQRRAAQETNVPVQTINDLIRKADKTPDLPTLRKLADGLSVSIVRLIELSGYLTGGNEKPDPLADLTDEDRAVLDTLSREELRAVIDLVRRLRGQL